MAKYSTGNGGSGGDGDSCELCGTASSRLSKANVEGAVLLVCPDCAPHDDNRKTTSDDDGGSGGSSSGASGGSSDGPEDRKKRVAQRQAEVYDAAKGDSTHWEKEGTNYEGDRLPYLVADYGDRVTEAREAAGRSIADLAADLDVDEADLEAVEGGRATRADVGGSVVRALEDEFDIDLVDE
ncbi:multiprotein-bridging factor 1 family protein [Halonotius terrestris]|uniref:Multiprotein-bridging factor 1 family protein n=1 Tax=Halonotius terrestris TaxID=2487750 RepID=A0A8J8TAV7_9EURY|nr:multiprotein-bridging factor 1 family protein [Halonotius terrestris]TQQ79788.1 multiprotein-bridging factor 1 family protein [Halonotius terrestris]